MFVPSAGLVVVPAVQHDNFVYYNGFAFCNKFLSCCTNYLLVVKIRIDLKDLPDKIFPKFNDLLSYALGLYFKFPSVASDISETSSKLLRIKKPFNFLVCLLLLINCEWI